MKFAKIIIFNVLFALLLSVGASAASKYIVDDANVLKQDTINTVEQNLNKIEENTEVTIKFDIIKSLNGKSIDEYAKQYAKDNISGDQYILFVSSIGDKKNKLLVGEKANNILSKSEIENIVSLPNQDFKSNNFDAGIIKVGKSLDEKVTKKAIQTGKSTVSNNGYSNSVEHKTNYLKVFLICLLVIGIGVVIFILVRRKINNDYEKRRREFASANNLDSYLDNDSSFRSTNVKNTEKSTFSRGSSASSSTTTSHSDRADIRSNYNSTGRTTYGDSTSKVYSEETRTTGNSNINNTTIINNNNDDKFFEGMIMGSMLSNVTNHHCEEHEHHHEHNNYEDHDYKRYSTDYKSHEKTYEVDNTPTVTSGNWNDDSSVSSWANTNSKDDETSSISNWNDD